MLRRTCVATKMLSVYAKWKGTAYLRSTLTKVVERLMLTSKDLNLELDPTRTNTEEGLQNNAIQLQTVAKVFIDDICASSANIPASFRKICSIVSPSTIAGGYRVLTASSDLRSGNAPIPGGQVYCCRRVHLSALLLSGHCCSRGRGTRVLVPVKGDASRPTTHRQGHTELGEQRLVWRKGALHVPAQ